MAPVEINYVPNNSVAPVKSLKMVDKAMALPIVNSAYNEVSKMTSPYVESTMSKITPVVENTWSKVTPVMETVKTKMEESVLPRIPSKVSETAMNVHNATVDNLTAAMDKVDTFACGGIDQLTDKVPQLKETTPKIIEDTKVQELGEDDLYKTYYYKLLVDLNEQLHDLNFRLCRQFQGFPGCNQSH